MIAPCRAGLALVLLLAALVRADEALPTPEALARTCADEWFGVYIEGKKCGYARITSARGGTATDPVFTSSSRMVGRLLAMGQRVEIESVDERVFDGRPPYALRSARLVHREGGESRVRDLSRSAGGYRMVVREAGGQRTLDLTPLKHGFADVAAGALWFERPRRVGDLVRVPEVDFDDWELTEEKVTVKAVKELMLQGVRTRVYEVAVQHSKQGDVGEALLDARGRMISMKVSGLFDLRAEPERLAKQIEYSADLFVRGMVKVDKPLGEAGRVTRLEVRVHGPVEALGPASLQVVRREGASAVLVIDQKGELLPASAEQVARALRDTPQVPVRHPEVAALARRAVGDAATPREKVLRLVRFVSEYVEDAYGHDTSSVLQVIRQRKGDCTEHSALLTALARAAGIPCREVGGVAYMGDEVQAFGGHAWNEVALDGKWVPVDATWNEPLTSATHVRLEVEDGKDSASAWKAYGKLRFELIAVRRAD